jgi:hypothetical protein
MYITTNCIYCKLLIAVCFKKMFGVSSLKMETMLKRMKLSTRKVHRFWNGTFIGVTKVVMYHNARNEWCKTVLLCSVTMKPFYLHVTIYNSRTSVNVFYHINVNICLNCFNYSFINVCEDCSVVCHTCTVVNSIASFSWDILFWLTFSMQMFCSTAVLWDTSNFLFFQAVA